MRVYKPLAYVTILQSITRIGEFLSNVDQVPCSGKLRTLEKTQSGLKTAIYRLQVRVRQCMAVTNKQSR